MNVNRIKAIRSGAVGEWLVVLDDGREFLMARGQRVFAQG